MSRDELILAIGTAVVNGLEKIEKEKFRGAFLKVPIQLKGQSANQPAPWISAVTIDIPSMHWSELKFDKDGRPYSDFKSMTMAEFYGW